MKTQNFDQKMGFKTIIKKSWPCFISYASNAVSISALFINVIIFSNIIWPGEAFHATEIGLLLGFSTYTMALSGLLFGYLADKVSRVKLISACTLFFGLSLLFNGFAPEGLGMETYIYFLTCILARGFFVGGFWPIINSFINDATIEQERSQFFGALQGVFQVVQIIGMVFSAVMFQSNLWRIYFWIVGGGILILGLFQMKGSEPKRAANYEEFQDILADKDIFYEYRLNKKSIKDTIFKPTNIIAFAEGIFTTILLSVPDFLLIAYIQSTPHNISPLSSSLIMIFFGLPGGIIGAVVFAKISDKLAKRTIRNRIYVIIVSIISIFMVYFLVFYLPLPHLSVAEGNNILIILSYPILWVMGFGALMGRALGGLYSINQPPVLQKINLPEAQGTISSSNQFLEHIGYGTGPILAGILLTTFNQNYQITITITMSLGIIGALMWLLALFWIEKDVSRVSSILKKRSIELKIKNNMALPNTIKNN